MKPSAIAPLKSIEGLRFIASVAIVFSHFLPYPMGREIAPVQNLGVFVDLFFVISGIVIASNYADRIHTSGDYGLFMQRRLARLLPLHLATMAFYIAIGLAMTLGLLKVVNPDRYDWAYLPEYLTLTQGWFLQSKIAWNAVTWSISAELIAYLLFPLLLFMLRGSLASGFAWIVITTLAAAFVAEIVASRSFPELVTNVPYVRALPGFMFGVWLALYQAQLRALLSDAESYAVFLTGWGILIGAILLDLHPYIGLGASWAIVAGAYFRDVAGRSTWAGRPFFATQGKLTYSIYLIHPIIATSVLAFIGPRLVGRTGAGGWTTLVLAFLMTYVLAWLSYHYFEEPMRRALGRPLFGRARTQTPAAPQEAQ